MAPTRTMPLAGRMPGRRAGPASWSLVIRYAQCSDSGLDPDQWFPVSADTGRARQEAAAAIAICATCPVRGHCLTLSLRHWDIGQHGVWGGLVAADRAQLRARLPAGRTRGPGLTIVQDDGAAVMSRLRWWLGTGRDVQ